MSAIESQKRKAQHQKFHRAHKLPQELASLASEVGMAAFERRLDAMKMLKDSWTKGKEAVVIEASENSSSGKPVISCYTYQLDYIALLR